MRSCVITDNRQLRMPRSFHCILLFSLPPSIPDSCFPREESNTTEKNPHMLLLSICVENADASCNLWHNTRITLRSAFWEFPKENEKHRCFLGRVKTIFDRCRSASQSFQSFRHGKGWPRLNVEHQKENEKFHLRVMNKSDDFSLNFLFSSF